MATVALLANLTGCAVLGPYPYSGRSAPSAPAQERAEQHAAVHLDSALADVCHLLTTRRSAKRLWLFGTVQSRGSAVLLDGRYLLTAAHNVADYPLGFSSLQRLEVSCGTLHASDATVESTLDRKAIEAGVKAPRYAWRLHHQWRKYENDYAFVDLGRELPSPRAFSLTVPDLARGDAVTLAGFPGGAIADAKTLHHATGVIEDVDGSLLTYDIGTTTGNSGGPVWTNRSGRIALVGVHVSGSVGGVARMITGDLLSEWAAWRQARPPMR